MSVKGPNISRVLFVCTGNTCRSPLAEVYARKAYPTMKFTSAGLSAAVGQPASANSIRVAEKDSLDLSEHKSQRVRELDPADFDLILGMTHSHTQRLRTIWEEHAIELLGKYSSESSDIADPFGGTESQYQRAFEEIRTGVDAWMDRLRAD